VMEELGRLEVESMGLVGEISGGGEEEARGSEEMVSGEEVDLLRG